VVKRPQIEARSRLPEGQAISSLSPLDLLDLYWRASNNDTAEVKALQELARQILSEDNESPKPSL
jgi:hypothetical protein